METSRLENAAWLGLVGCACLSLFLLFSAISGAPGQPAVVRSVGTIVYLLRPVIVTGSDTQIH